MEMKLEVIMLPVSDVEISLQFYRDKLGFELDHDLRPGNGMRVIQLTPHGSGCSVVFGDGMGGLAEPGSLRNTHLVVKDIASVRQQLIENAVDVTPIDDMGGVRYAYFSDPDGNSWALQEISRLVL